MFDRLQKSFKIVCPDKKCACLRVIAKVQDFDSHLSFNNMIYLQGFEKGLV